MRYSPGSLLIVLSPSDAERDRFVERTIAERGVVFSLGRVTRAAGRPRGGGRDGRARQELLTAAVKKRLEVSDTVVLPIEGLDPATREPWLRMAAALRRPRHAILLEAGRDEADEERRALLNDLRKALDAGELGNEGFQTAMRLGGNSIVGAQGDHLRPAARGGLTPAPQVRGRARVQAGMGRGRFTGVLVTALVAVGCPAVAGAAPPPSVLRAGAAQADITSPVGTPMFAYTARSYIFSPDPVATQERALQIIGDPDTGLYAKSFEPSNGIHTRVRARAVILQRVGGPKFALVQADLGGLPYAMVQEVLKRIPGTGIDGSRLLISATHTHSSMGNIWPADNSGYAFVGGDAFDPRTFAQIAQGIADAIIAANARLAPARIGVGTTQLTDASRNREFDVYQRNPDIPPASDPAAQRADSIDPTMTVIRVDAEDGTPMAVWSNFAVHPTSFGDGNLLFSGDNAGVAERLAEQAIVANAQKNGHGTPEVVNVWTNGAEGDTSPDGDNRSIGGQAVHYVPDRRGEGAPRRVADRRRDRGRLA